MRAVELELLVLNVMTAARAGRPVEDDRIEFKRDWPESAKARQLAGLANTLRGEPVVYIIGADENGNVYPIAPREVGQWYADFVKGFGSLPPAIILNRNITLGDDGADTVLALAFETDGFPYMFNIEGKHDRREVPIRSGTETKTANRADLLRILQPTVNVPPTKLVEVHVSARFANFGEISMPGRLGRPPRTEVRLEGSATVFVEYVGQHQVTIPVAAIHAKLFLAGREFGFAPHFAGRGKDDPTPPRFGVWDEGGFIISTGPGTFSFRLHDKQICTTEDRDVELLPWVYALNDADSVALDLRFAFTGSDRRISHSLTGSRTKPGSFDRDVWDAGGRGNIASWAGNAEGWVSERSW